MTPQTITVKEGSSMAQKSRVLLKFADDENFYKCEVQRMSEHMIKVVGLIQDLSGFQIFTDSKDMIGDYSNYVHEYANPNLGDNIYEYTDNGAMYPDEGADKSLKEQILDELKTYIDAQAEIIETKLNKSLDDLKRELNQTIESNKEDAIAQFDELQDTLIDVYSTIQDISFTVNTIAGDKTRNSDSEE